MENPATWGEAERVINQAYIDWYKGQQEMRAGLSLPRMIADALRSHGLMPASGPKPSLTAARMLLGKRVRVTLDPATIVTGKLLGFGGSGEFEIEDDADGCVHYCWPMLKIEEIRNDPGAPQAGMPAEVVGDDLHEHLPVDSAAED